MYLTVILLFHTRLFCLSGLLRHVLFCVTPSRIECDEEEPVLGFGVPPPSTQSVLLTHGDQQMFSRRVDGDAVDETRPNLAAACLFPILTAVFVITA